MSFVDVPVDTSAVADEYQRRGLAHWSDAQLIGAASGVLERPRRDPADSFVLHAPLELVARAALLPFVAPDGRERARLRIVSLAAQFAAAGPAAPDPEPTTYRDPGQAAARLVAAIDAGDLDGVDQAAAWLGRAVAPDELVRLLGSDMVPRLAAAAHGPILLYHLPRVSPRGEVPVGLIRGPARELGRHPDWRIRWIEGPRAAGAAPASALLEALQATPRLGAPEETFVHPVMAQVDDAGVAAELLAAVTGGSAFAERGRLVLRCAAWSMLQEPPDHAAYGWTHCLTLPQAVLGIAGRLRERSGVLAVAATYIVGFRAAFATQPLVADYAPVNPGVALDEALHHGPAVAAASAFHAAADDPAGVVARLATAASQQRDAHLVKYTLACIDAGAADLSARALYLAAAAYLAAWWNPIVDTADSLTPSA